MKIKKGSVHQTSLYKKISRLIVLIVLIVLVLVLAIFSYIVISEKFKDVGNQVLSIAKTVATMPEVIHAFNAKDPSKIIDPVAEDIRSKTGAEFIVVSNMDLIRYSHPTKDKIGEKMSPVNDNQQVLKGKESITRAAGSLGLSVRGKYPVFNSNHQQIGLVSVGMLESTIWNNLAKDFMMIAATGLIGIGLGMYGAFLLSRRIKREMFNMEPFEIAYLSQEQSAILETIKEGIIAVNKKGEIKICNKEAQKILESSKNLVGKHIMSIAPNSRLMEVLENGVIHVDQPMLLGNTLVITNRLPVFLNGEVVGAVASFRDKIMLEKMDEQLMCISQYIESLRSQRHEYMNRLHTISGLIQLEEYDLVKDLIVKMNVDYQQAINFFMSKIKDPAVVAVMIGKMHRAKEVGIELQIDPDSSLSNSCPHRETVVTILGNGIENAIEAIINMDRKPQKAEILISIKESKKDVFISITDNGPGIDLKIGGRIFDEGVSTKGPGRGFGLSLLSRLVSNINGDLKILSSDQGTILQAEFPIERKISDHEKEFSCGSSR